MNNDAFWMSVCYDSTLSIEERYELVLSSAPPEWKGEMALANPDLTAGQRLELIYLSTPLFRGLAACYVSGLPCDTRSSLVRTSNNPEEWAERLLIEKAGFTPEETVELFELVPREKRGPLALNRTGIDSTLRMEYFLGSPDFLLDAVTDAGGLTSSDRFTLANNLSSKEIGEAALRAPGLTNEERFELASKADNDGREMFAMNADFLPDEKRVALIETCPFEKKLHFILYAPGISSKTKVEMACNLNEDAVGNIAANADDLDPAHRIQLALRTTPEWAGNTAYNGHWLTSNQRKALARCSNRKWRLAMAVNRMPEWYVE